MYIYDDIKFTHISHVGIDQPESASDRIRITAQHCEDLRDDRPPCTNRSPKESLQKRVSLQEMLPSAEGK